MKKTLRLRIERVERTDLMCIACGNFRTEFAIDNGGEPQSGIHKKCIAAVHAKREVSKQPPPTKAEGAMETRP